jgi:acyl CoA:acetate/3-ketoacid CoA transferase beta subunit
VCECPYGGYPYGFDAAIPGLPVGYGPVIKTIATYREALKNLDTHRELISSASLATSEERFISGLDSNQLAESRRTFLQSLRQGRAIRARRSVQPRQKLVATVELSSLSPGQRMALVGSRRILDSVRLRGTNVVLVGVGRPRDACAMAQDVLRAEGYDVLFLVGTGMVGLDLSGRGQPFDLSSSTFLTDTVDVYGSILGGPRSRSLALLGAAQVDRRGRLNSTYIQEHDQMLAGGGGAADAATLSSEILAMVPNRTGRFVELVDFVTSPSNRLTEVVTDFGSLRLSMSKAELVLFRRFVSTDDVSDATAEIGTRSGWVPDVSEASIEPPATREEVELLRMFTPD